MSTTQSSVSLERYTSISDFTAVHNTHLLKRQKRQKRLKLMSGAYSEILTPSRVRKVFGSKIDRAHTATMRETHIKLWKDIVTSSTSSNRGAHEKNLRSVYFTNLSFDWIMFTNRFRSVNVNLGPDAFEWLAVSAAHMPTLCRYM
jgi:hypothetical protein